MITGNFVPNFTCKIWNLWVISATEDDYVKLPDDSTNSMTKHI